MTPEVIHILACREKAPTAVARRKEESRQYGTLEERASPPLARRMTQLSSKGASIWLTTLHLRESGFHLSKGDFQDALTLRYGRQLQEVTAMCRCGEPLTTLPCYVLLTPWFSHHPPLWKAASSEHMVGVTLT